MTREEREVIFEWSRHHSVDYLCANHWPDPETPEEVAADGGPCEECAANSAFIKLLERVEAES